MNSIVLAVLVLLVILVVAYMYLSMGPKTKTIMVMNKPGEYLHFAELQALDKNKKNVALAGRATASSAYDEAHGPSKVIDGNVNPSFNGASIYHSGGRYNEWVRIDLAEPTELKKLVIYNRVDAGGNYPDLLAGAQLQLLDEDGNLIKDFVLNGGVVQSIDL